MGNIMLAQENAIAPSQGGQVPDTRELKIVGSKTYPALREDGEGKVGSEAGCYLIP